VKKLKFVAITVVILTVILTLLAISVISHTSISEVSSSYTTYSITTPAIIDVFITPHESNFCDVKIKLNQNTSIYNLTLKVHSNKAVIIKPTVKSSIPVKFYPEKELIYPEGIFTFSFNVSDLHSGIYRCEIHLSGNYSGNCTVRLKIFVPPKIFVYPDHITCVINGTKNISINVENKDNLNYSVNAYFERFYGNCIVNVFSPKELLPHSKTKIFLTINGYGGGNLVLWLSNGKIHFTKVVGIESFEMPEKPKILTFNVSKAKEIKVIVSIKGCSTVLGKVKLFSPNKEIKPSSVVNEIDNGNKNLTYVFKVKNPEKGKWKVLIQTPFHYSVKFIKIFE